MSHLIIRPLSGPNDLPLFNQLNYVLDDEYADDLQHARRRPEWMWLALRDDHLVARAAWWGRAGAERPLLMDVLDLDPTTADRHVVASELVRSALAAMDLTAAPPEYGRYLQAGWRNDPAQTRELTERTAVIEHLGGRRLVERLRLQWGPGTTSPSDSGRLTFRRPEGHGELLDLLTRVLEGTLDEHSRAELQTGSPRDVATEQLDGEFPTYRGSRDWWAIGCLPRGEPVGLVIPTRNDYNSIIAYVGVLPGHRGHGYIDDLLDHGTRVLADAGASIIKASTDCANTPMAAAFHRRGYPTTGEEIDYVFPGSS
ncbi:GNAT family N-acetyltransferase [Leekyejoonella antrihumi]|uniref:GNAT family N-acetyltransferase n=1 Tax=Leekyejoonella antrihumi TaxID=1660198 RepID=A0A563E401_9MICO|nr:GNAT family N-acetyltransferase [Leekyejoonella antrihumi]TWP37246.1 GNAT family N-acetyltransferase [Leekyejoonella antrihumi]